jgi:hypothetical protein
MIEITHNHKGEIEILKTRGFLFQLLKFIFMGLFFK